MKKENKYGKLLEEWQERLGLQDWYICLRYNCKYEDFDGKRDGQIKVLSESKQALIKILDKNLYTGIIGYDFEYILVHELLHCKFDIISCCSQLYEGVVTDEVRHQLIDDLARALVMAKRGQTKRKLAKTAKKVRNWGAE